MRPRAFGSHDRTTVALPIAIAGIVSAIILVAPPTAVATGGRDAHPAAARESVSGVQVLNDVACPTTKRCVAVGSDANEAGKGVAINASSGSASLGHGTLQNAPLTAVACPTKSRCLGVGNEQIASVKVSSGAVKRTATVKPPAGSIVAMGAIACASSTTCYAVGFEGTPSSGTPLVAELSGSGSLRDTTTGSGTGIAAIACPASSRCLMAVSNGSRKEWIQLLTRGKFGSKNPLSKTFVQSLSCFKAKLCMALAGKTGGVPDEVISLDPKTGKPGKLATLHHFDGQHITCTTASKCLVVGFSGTGATAKPGVVTVTRGKPGKIVHYPGTNLDSAACATAKRCYAVGLGPTSAIIDRL